MAIGTAVWPGYGRGADETVIERPDDALREMAELLRDTRPGMLVSGVTVAVVSVGATIVEVAAPTNMHAGVGTLLSLAMFGMLVLSIIRTAVLMISAGRPGLDELGELRRRTGAPVNPKVPWTPVRRLPETNPTPGWERARAVLAAAHFSNARIHLAQMWATTAIIFFVVWTVVQLLLAGGI